ncbi:hypothetical protein BRARA_G01392 [Brassica rapa]|uniref:Uncharacterized protein n=1 Tax=Brassica campestris TaxID=3711 RepID=A0A397YKS5_BRACM|nr:hypothetical protein BRARA_G01392 [Brassica rapa]
MDLKRKKSETKILEKDLVENISTPSGFFRHAASPHRLAASPLRCISCSATATSPCSATAATSCTSSQRRAYSVLKKAFASGP